MYIATSQEMNNIDRRASCEYGIPALILMENAASAITRVVAEMSGSVKGKRITIVCGKGNNGGDGLASARQLYNRGADVRVYLLSEPGVLKGDAATNLHIATKMGIEVQDRNMYDLRTFQSVLNHSHVIIDAIIGTGLSSPVRGDYKDIIELINSTERPVVAVDIPSGINSDSGEVMGMAIKAAATVTFALPKRGHILYPGCEFSGKLHISDISIPLAAIETESIYLHLLTEDGIRGLVSQRHADTHKGSFGHALVIAGSLGKGGAAAMTSLACLRVGAGLVTLAVPESVHHIVAEKLTEVMTHPLAETYEKTIALSAVETVLELSKDKEAVAIGPGMTTHKDIAAVTRRLIKELAPPVVIDADAINALAGHLEILKERTSPAILTPHPGEMGRLTGTSTADVQKDRIGCARSFATGHGVYLILKGAHTVIAEPSGDVHVSTTGNPGMATAGTGDALTGILAGLIAQGVEISAAARLAVYLHGLAGDIAAREIGMVGMLAGDLITRIPAAISYLTGETHMPLPGHKGA